MQLLEIIRILIDAGANVMACNITHETCLHNFAARKHRLEDAEEEKAIVELLYKKGVNLSSKDKFENYAFKIARQHGNKRLAKLITP